MTEPLGMHLQPILARARAYDLFADIILDGVTAEGRCKLDGLPELQSLLTGYSDDDLAATHYAVFWHSLYPFENIFVSHDRHAGGAAADKLAAFYQRCGFQPQKATPTPDHLSTLLESLAHLLISELEHARHGHAAAVHRWQAAQVELLDEHLLKWLPVFIIALRRETAAMPSAAFFTAIGDLLLDVVCDHRCSLLASFPLPRAPTYAEGAAESEDELLNQGQGGVHDIARYLLTPARAGLWLGRQDVQSIARRLQLPRGFGDRLTELCNLMQAAVQYDALPALINELSALVGSWQEGISSALVTNSALGLEQAQCEVFSNRDFWLGQLSNTTGILNSALSSN